MKIYSIPLLFVLFCYSAAFTQPPPVPNSPSSQNIIKEPSLKETIKSESFSSPDGKFAISLPSRISGFSPISSKQLGFNASGGAYIWNFQEGIVQVLFFEYAATEAPKLKNEQDYVNFFAGVSDGTLKTHSAKLISEKLLKLGDNYGLKIIYSLPNGARFINYFYLIGNRMYSLIGAFDPSQEGAEKLFTEALETFKITTQADIDAEIRRKVEAATPKPLPQEPVASRLKSDAEEEGLNGKVKMILQESESLSGSGSRQAKTISLIEYYNEMGNLVKREYYDYRNNPYNITVYGFIDGKRVSKSGHISYAYNPPPPKPIPPNPDEKPKPKSDPRYEYEHVSKYENGKLIESQLLHSNGLLLTKTVYKYVDNQIEKLVYSSDGSLNQRYVTILDKDGNVIEQTNYDQTKQKYYGDRKYSYNYEFDAKGNWIKKITSQQVEENGKMAFKPQYVTFRKITYYE